MAEPSKVKLVAGGNVVVKAAKSKSDNQRDAVVDDETEEDALSWVMKMRQRKKTSPSSSSPVRKSSSGQLSASKSENTINEDLSGIQVAHGLDDFQAGEERVLILQDTSVLGPTSYDQDDQELYGMNNSVLINQELDMERKRRHGLEQQGKKVPYSGLAEYGKGGQRSLLSQYDKDHQDGKSFILGQHATAKEYLEESERDFQLQKYDLSSTEGDMNTMRDFYTGDEMRRILKPVLRSQEKKKRNLRTHGEESDVTVPPTLSSQPDSFGPEQHEQQQQQPASKKQKLQEKFTPEEDDTDLQSSLAKNRRKELRKRTVMYSTAEEIAEQVKTEAKYHSTDQLTEERKTVVISDVADFVSRIQTPATAKLPVPVQYRPSQINSVEDTSVSQSDGMVKDEVASLTSSNHSQQGTPTLSVTDLSGERLIERGVGGALSMLRKKGILKEGAAEKERAKRFEEKQKWAADIALKEAKAAKLLQVEKERRRQQLQQQQQQQPNQKSIVTSSSSASKDRSSAAFTSLGLNPGDKFAHYKPDISLHYYDSEGRELSHKEAFRELSHRFHGKTPGKMKTEKKMKKLEVAKAIKSMGMTDTPLHLASSMTDKQKMMGSAHIIVGTATGTTSSIAGGINVGGLGIGAVPYARHEATREDRSIVPDTGVSSTLSAGTMSVLSGGTSKEGLQSSLSSASASLGSSQKKVFGMRSK